MVLRPRKKWVKVGSCTHRRDMTIWWKAALNPNKQILGSSGPLTGSWKDGEASKLSFLQGSCIRFCPPPLYPKNKPCKRVTSYLSFASTKSNDRDLNWHKNEQRLVETREKIQASFSNCVTNFRYCLLKNEYRFEHGTPAGRPAASVYT